MRKIWKVKMQRLKLGFGHELKEQKPKGKGTKQDHKIKLSATIKGCGRCLSSASMQAKHTPLYLVAALCARHF
nr:hypothetical protein Itr_chr02CG15700 [Ipomoea trifida]